MTDDLMMTSKRTTLLLIGREGNGKTSCIQTLGKFQGSQINVIECVGVGETGSDLIDDVHVLLKNVETIIKSCDEEHGGIDAFGFVLKYGVRFTQQEKHAVQVARLIFGQDIFKKWGLIIFTYGDLFECHVTFAEWCQEQSGDIQRLFQEVDYKCVLLDNKTNDEQILIDQYEDLDKYIAKNNQFRKYNYAQYEKAHQGRDTYLRTETQKPIWQGFNESQDKQKNYSLMHLFILYLFIYIFRICTYTFTKFTILSMKLLRIPICLNTKIRNYIYYLKTLISACFSFGFFWCLWFVLVPKKVFLMIRR
uniref:AIG1-type G domain-containing protein n=1 Tax=Biomphalaria glabrata TaxID=6526 RepID=A0A2C9KTU2_BIOGL